jgi:uncharacterized protein (DUF58 family)
MRKNREKSGVEGVPTSNRGQACPERSRGNARDRTRLGLTDAGRTVLRGTGFVALAALIVPAFGVLSALVSVLLVALIVGYAVRPRIRIDGDLPDRVVGGQTARLTYLIRNLARLPAYNFSLELEALPESIELVTGPKVVQHLGPGETAEVTVTIRPKRRGLFQINKPVCRSGFPFNLFTFATTGDNPETLIVLPVFSRLQFPVRNLGRHVSSSGTRLAGIAGAFPEYAGSRPFVTGDSPRNIDSRAWARLAAPATKEYHDDFDNHTALVLDTCVPKALRRSSTDEIREFEAAVSLCASVAFTVNNDCLIDMMLAGPDLHLFDSRSRRVRLDKIHEILAGVESHEDFDLEHTLPIAADRFYEVSEVVFVLMNWNEAYEQLLDKATGAGCHTTVLMIDGSETTHVTGVANRPGNIRFISADEVLTGQVRRL